MWWDGLGFQKANYHFYNFRSFAPFSRGISFRATCPQDTVLLDIITRSNSQRCKALPRLHGLLPAMSDRCKGPWKASRSR